MVTVSQRESGLPPAILMGGQMGNAVSVARSLGRSGVPVYLLASSDTPETYSRYVRHIRLDTRQQPVDAWSEYLLSPAARDLHGAVLLACSDPGIEVLLEHREALGELYTLDISNPAAQRCFLNKLTTYEEAVEAGVPSPRFWPADSQEELARRKGEYVYPLIVKPLFSHKFSSIFGEKFFLARDFEELLEGFGRAGEHGLDVVLVEQIPGPDDRLCSYFTYIDEAGVPQFDYTKRVIRRYPENHGLGCYHVTDWNPEVREVARRLLRHSGLVGLANVEFKRDDRDGKLKVIECNARFTAANGLVAESGYDLALFVYNRLTGRPQASLDGRPYTQGLHLWYPMNDLRAFLELRGKGRLSLGSWVRSLLHRQVLVYFRWDDPLPSLMEWRKQAGSAAGWMRGRAGERARAIGRRVDDG